MLAIKRNLLGNFAGKIWVTLVNYGSIPFYLKLLGMEAYGLVAFNATLNALFALLDFGFSMTMNKGLAKLSEEQDSADEGRDFLRTIEAIYWPISILIVTTIALLAPLISSRWLTPETISQLRVQKAVMLMGASIACLWPYTLYQGGMLGLQKQVKMNFLSACFATAQSFGGVIALMAFGATLEVYFYWQILVSITMSLVTMLTLWRSLPKGSRPARFKLSILKQEWGFSIGMLGISVASYFSLQADKLLLGKLVSLKLYACYSVASQACNLITLCVFPITTAIFPRVVQLLHRKEEVELTGLYHKTSQYISFITIPLAATLCCFATPITKVIERFSSKPLLIQHTDKVMSILAIGALFHALTQFPHLVQLAANWTKLWLVHNLISIFIQIPLMVCMTQRYGISGCATVYLLLTTSYLLIQIPVMHTRLILGEAKRWFLQDVGVIGAIVFSSGFLLRTFASESDSILVILLKVPFIFMVLLGMSFLASSYLRNSISVIVKKNFLKIANENEAS